MHSETVEEHLKRWDEGQNIFTIEMVGLGPGHEQAIQVLAIEILRKVHEVQPDLEEMDNMDNDDIRELTGPVVIELNEDWGFSGAQIGAAHNLAFRIYRISPIGAIEEMREIDDSRIIQTSKHLGFIKQ